MITAKRTFLLISFLCSIIILEAKTYVVSVGISHYKNINSLVLPDKDAKSISNLYKQKTKDVILITGKYATKGKILKSLRDQFARASSNDMIIFYFSGHGYPGGICPYDMTNDIRTGLSYKEIKAILKKSKAKNKIIIADACFSGGLRVGAQSSGSADNDKDKSVILFLSSRSNETSGENTLLSNGYFTKALVRGLKGGADVNRDKLITAKEIFTFVSNDVQKKTKSQQHPVMWGKFDDSFVLMDWR